MTQEQIREMIAQGLPTGGGGGSSGGAMSGGGTASIAGVQAELSRRLDSAWIQPRHLSGNSGLKVIASVDVQRDGHIRGSRILTRSGNAELDRSVQDALSVVKFAMPLPSSYSGAHHTFEIEFSLTRE
jgi:TonB family protein